LSEQAVAQHLCRDPGAVGNEEGNTFLRGHK
jgi:hypothetical protein